MLNPYGESPQGFLPLGSRVITPAGCLAVEYVRPGDVICSGDGTRAPVATIASASADDGLVHLMIRGLCRPLSLAPGQLVWAIKGETKKCATVGAKWSALIGLGDRPQWIYADHLGPGDYIHIPRGVGDATPISEDLAWAYGLYIAEGSSLVDGGATKAHHRVCMTMHERELAILGRFADIFERELGMSGYRLWTRKRQAPSGFRAQPGLSSEYVRAGRAEAVFLREMFGHGARNKHLPVWMLDLAPTLKRAVLQGWFDGDGHTGTRPDGSTQTSASTISEALVMQMFQLAVGAGQFPSIARLEAGGRRKSDSYTIHLNAGQEACEVNGDLFYRLNARYRNAAPSLGFRIALDGADSCVVEHASVLSR